MKYSPNALYTPPDDVTAVDSYIYTTANRPVLVVLDLVSGRLWAEQWDAEPAVSYHPERDLWFVGRSHDWWCRYPRRLGWVTADTQAWQSHATATMQAIVKWAKALVDALVPLPAGGYDWTLRATAAYERIERLVRRPGGADEMGELPERHHYGAVSFDEIAAADPAWVDPAWAVMSDEELDVVAEGITNPWRGSAEPKPVSDRAKQVLRSTIVFGWRRNASWAAEKDLAVKNRNLPLHPVGVRAGLRRWRDAQITAAGGLPAVNAAGVVDASLAYAHGLRATSTDEEVARVAALISVDVAHTRQQALTNTVPVLRRHRAAMRGGVRAELARLGKQHQIVEHELVRLTERRGELMRQVAAFREAPEWDPAAGKVNYAKLGELAHMTRQGVRAHFTGAAGQET